MKKIQQSIIISRQSIELVIHTKTKIIKTIKFDTNLSEDLFLADNNKKLLSIKDKSFFCNYNLILKDYYVQYGSTTVELNDDSIFLNIVKDTNNSNVVEIYIKEIIVQNIKDYMLMSKLKIKQITTYEYLVSKYFTNYSKSNYVVINECEYNIYLYKFENGLFTTLISIKNENDINTYIGLDKTLISFSSKHKLDDIILLNCNNKPFVDYLLNTISIEPTVLTIDYLDIVNVKVNNFAFFYRIINMFK